MRLSSILRLYRARLRARVVLVQELFAVLGLAVGVALLFASQVASASLNGSVRQFTSGIVGQSRLQLAARDAQGFDERLFGAVQHLPGVRAAIPVLEVRADLVGPAGEEPVDLLASDPRYAHLAGPLLQHFSIAQLAAQRALALPAPVARRIGAAPLRGVELRIGARSNRVLVGTQLGEADIGALVNSPIALAPLAYIQQLAGLQGKITSILVQPWPGRASLARAGLLKIAAGHLNVEPADADAAFFAQAAGPIDQSTGTFSAIGALVGFMFAYCAMLLTVPLRRGLIRDLRRDGATRWMTIKTLLFDAIALGVVASALGLALGELLSITLLRSNPGYLSFAFPVGSQRIVTWQSITLAIGAGLVAACIGVLTPLRDIFSRSMRSFVSRRALEHREWTLQAVAGGLACLALTTVILIVAPQSSVLGVVTLIAGMVLLLPPLLRGAVAAFDRLQRPLMSGAARLTVVELQSPPARARSLAIAATGAIAVFAGVTIQGATDNLQHGLDRLVKQLASTAQVWVVAPGAQNLLATTPFSSNGAAALEHLAGVRAVGLYRAGFLDYSGRRLWVIAPPANAEHPIPPSQLVVGNLADATAKLKDGGWAVLSRALAAQHHLEVGQTFTLPGPNPGQFRVAALSTNLGWPPGAIILGSQDYARVWGSTDASAYNVMLAPGASAAQVTGEIRRTLGPASGLVVETAAQRVGHQQAASRRGLERLTQIAALVLIAGVLAISVAMSAMISQRRPQLARMKLEGFPTKGLWHSLLLESALLLGGGCSVGALFGIYGQLLLSHALLAVTGFPVAFSVEALPAFACFAIVTVAAATIVAVPGYRAASVRPYPVT
jgi:putative ABC transport system permease protein